MSILRTQQLRFRYPAQPNWALDGVGLAIRSGELTWFTGALGSGTSTALLALAGLAPRLTGGERQGVVELEGHDPATLNPIHAGIAYLGPSPALQLSGIARTVRDEVAVGPMNLGWDRDRILDSVERAMTRVRVDHLADRAPGALSGGETQRVLIAALLAVRPSIWLLDEPFSALDHPSRELVGALCVEVAREGAAVLIASDDADQMAPLADRLVVFSRGTVALDGSAGALLAGDALLLTGASTTDAGRLAAMAGWPAPRPLTAAALLAQRATHQATQTAVNRPARAATPVSPRHLPTSSPAPILALEAVGFGYDRGLQVLRDVSLELGASEAVGLFGPNGAGKSTLLRLAMALEAPGSGVVRTLGRSTKGLSPEDLAPRVGFLFQQPERQLFATSVRAECAVALQLAGWSASRVGKAVDGVLEELGLSAVAGEHPYDLPLPSRRLVALASILVAGPELVLLDEPTAGLDGTSQERVIRVIRQRVETGLAALVITHDAIFAHETLDRALQLRGGTLVSNGSVRDVLDGTIMSRPAALAVALELGIPAGDDRRAQVAAVLSTTATGEVRP